MTCPDNEVIDLFYGSYDYGIKKLCGRCSDGTMLECVGDKSAYNNFTIEGAKHEMKKKVFYFTKDETELKGSLDKVDNYVVTLGNINENPPTYSIDADAKVGTVLDKSFNCYGGEYINGFYGSSKNKTEHLSDIIFKCGSYHLEVEKKEKNIILDNKIIVIVIVVLLAFVLRYIYETIKYNRKNRYSYN